MRKADQLRLCCALVGSTGNTSNTICKGTANGRTGGAVWYFYWEAPPQNVGPVTFYAAGNQANGDFDNTGDDILTATAISQPPGGSATVTEMIDFFITSAEYRQRFGPP